MEQINIEALPITVSFLGQTKRGSWACFEWRVEVQSQAGVWSSSYYCGLGHTVTRKDAPKPPPNRRSLAFEQWERAWKEPKKPSKSDILFCLLADADAANYNFQDWCDNCGYSSDSITALNVYQACLNTAAELRKHFGREALEQLKKQLEDY